MDVRFKNPCSILLAGSSQSGKTTLCLNLLRNVDDFFTDPRCKNNIIYYVKGNPDILSSFKHEKIVHEWIHQLPTVDDFKERTLLHKSSGGSIVVIDDFGEDFNKDIAEIFKVWCHHTNTVVILMTQNLFSQNKAYRDISLNSSYLIVFKNTRDGSQINHFSKQFSPGNPSFVTHAYREATKKPYSYILFDHTQTTPDIIRVRSNILPHEQPMIVWTPRKEAI